VILDDEPWIVTNARTDPRALANPLVAGEFGLQFYAGVPLRTRDGHALGTLCVMDFEPREVTAEELESLEDLAALVMSELEIRLAAVRARDASQSAAPLG
jgi:eukaryotic-like serine/threonine-protein kinase